MAKLTALTKVPAQLRSAKTIFYMHPEYGSPFIMGDGTFEKNENVLSRDTAGNKQRVMIYRSCVIIFMASTNLWFQIFNWQILFPATWTPKTTSLLTLVQYICQSKNSIDRALIYKSCAIIFMASTNLWFQIFNWQILFPATWTPKTTSSLTLIQYICHSKNSIDKDLSFL